MDPLAGLISGPRAQGAFLLRSLLEPPWSLRIADRAPLTLAAMLAGEAWFLREGHPPARLGPGELAIVRGPDPYVVADHPDTPPQVVVHPDQRCTTIAGEDVSAAMALGVRTWGNHPEGSTRMLTGTYHLDTEVSRRLLTALPGLVHVPADDAPASLLSTLTDELVRDEPGQEVILDRMLDLLLIAAVRAWFARPGARPPGWYLAHSDPVVGAALRMLHHDPAHRWTVGELAERVGCSRAALARRFTALVGEPPMTYLTAWRLTLAADLLAEPGATVASVAAEVGYATPYAFSAAFKRHHGVSPSRHRAARGHRHLAAG